VRTAASTPRAQKYGPPATVVGRITPDVASGSARIPFQINRSAGRAQTFGNAGSNANSGYHSVNELPGKRTSTSSTSGSSAWT
jgi:hypothetical protein